jgi:ATP-dependent Clp protease ATP-binding subunit ClpA
MVDHMTPPPSLQDLIDTVQHDSPSDDLLDLLVTASSTVAVLEATGDALLGHFVDRCRRSGKSWSQISDALGVSKQAVHKRFSTAIADRMLELRQPVTLERFTNRARSVMRAAAEGAQAAGRAQASPGDLLVGLYAEQEGVAALALTAMGVTREAIQAVWTALPPSAADATDTAADGAGAADAQASFTPGAVTALRDAVAEALELGNNYIGTEHILLGLIRDPDAAAATVLAGLGATREEISVRLAELVRGFTRP